MSYVQEKSDIETFFTANWPHTDIMFENGDYTGSNDEWVRLTVLNGEAYQASMGDDPAFRFPGVVVVQIYTKTDKGSGRALQLADFVDGLFRILVLGRINFKVPQVRRDPNPGEWFQINVSTDFYRGS